MSKEAKERLVQILDELDGLSAEAREIIEEHYPHVVPTINAYDCLNFGRSINPYDTTLETIIFNEIGNK